MADGAGFAAAIADQKIIARAAFEVAVGERRRGGAVYAGDEYGERRVLMTSSGVRIWP